MKRSTNGGGENSPKLEGEDDFYELFFAGLEQKENKNLNEQKYYEEMVLTFRYASSVLR